MRLKLSTADTANTAISYAEYGCPAGRPTTASCKHVAATCYALEELTRLVCNRDLVTCTSQVNAWNPPRARKLEPRKLKDISFKKVTFSDKRKKSAVSKRVLPKRLDLGARAKVNISPYALVTFALRNLPKVTVKV